MATLANGFAAFKEQIPDSSALLAEGLGAWDIKEVCREQGHRYRERTWPPLMTLWTFLLQVVHVGSSCREAVALALMGRSAAGDPKGDNASADPSAYCQARSKLPLAVFRRAVAALAEHLGTPWNADSLWHGKRVWLLDGSCVTLPDTPQLQRVFGQPSGQKPGCGFPKARLVAWFCWATGTIIKLTVAPWRRSELRMWRSLHKHLRANDLVLADRLFCTFADIAWMAWQGCAGIFRLHKSRYEDVNVVCRLGRGDCIVEWKRPA
jgi:hypothetical protein